MTFRFSRERTDKDLIQGIIRSDVGCYEQLFRRYYSTLLHFTSGMLKDADAAEDITQNIFMKLWIHRDRLDAEQSIKNYLFVLARHEIFNIFKAKRTTMLSLQPQMSDYNIADQSAEEHYNYTELNALLLQSISKMPPQRQLIFRMSRYEHLSNREIAERLNLSIRTVDKHIELAIKDLHSSLC